jgi:hypothetical protein
VDRVIEIYEGEPTVIVLLDDSHDLVSVKAYRSIFNDSGRREVEEIEPPFTNTLISNSAAREIAVDVSELSQWPAPFRLEIQYYDGPTLRTVKNSYDVVTQYAGVEDIAISGNVSITDTFAQNYQPWTVVREMESLARRTVEAFTGISFGRRYKKVQVDASDSTSLYLDEELSWVGAVFHDEEMIYGPGLDSTVNISDTGRLIEVYDSSGDKFGFPSGFNYYVVGIFGPEEVPYDVELATKQLAIFYLCADSSTMNKYVEQIKFGESAVKTNRMAFTGTGLRSVDLLLDHYRFHRYKLI